jgi:nucleoside-diphosphate-sugar epimerase
LVTGAPPPRSEYVPGWLSDLDGLRLDVLGADGFIGSHVVRLAVGAGAEVRALCVKQPWRIEDLAVEKVATPRWWEEDFPLDGGALILLAYEPPTGDDRLAHELEVNAAGVERVARAAPDRVVFASSADVYGSWHDEPVSEETEPAPTTPYAVAKLQAEQRLASYDAVSLRIATVYGPGETGPRAIPSFTRALAGGRAPTLHGDGNDVRDLVHVVDVAAALLNAAVADASPVVNVGSGAGMTTLEVLNAVCAASGRRTSPEWAPATRPPSRIVLDSRRARAELGFDPRPDFDGALAEEVRWLEAIIE